MVVKFSNEVVPSLIEGLRLIIQFFFAKKTHIGL